MYLVKLVKFTLDVEKCGNDYVLYYLSMYILLFYLEKYSGVLGKVRTRYGLKKSVFWKCYVCSIMFCCFTFFVQSDHISVERLYLLVSDGFFVLKIGNKFETTEIFLFTRLQR